MYAVAVIIAGGLLAFQNCSPVGTTADGSASSSSSSSPKGGGNMGGTTTDNPKATLSVVLSNSGGQATAAAKLCLGSIQFMTPDGQQTGSSGTIPSAKSPSATPHHVSGNTVNNHSNNMTTMTNNMANIMAMEQQMMQQYTQMLMGQFTVQPQDNFLQTMPVTPGDYTQIDLALDNSCEFGSLSMPSQSGQILQVSEPLVMHFTGSIDTSSQSQVVLQMQNILSALSQARTSAEIKSIVNRVAGGF